MEKQFVPQQLDIPFPGEPKQLHFDFEGELTESARPVTSDLLRQAAGASEHSLPPNASRELPPGASSGLPPNASWDIPPGASEPDNSRKRKSQGVWEGNLKDSPEKYSTPSAAAHIKATTLHEKVEGEEIKTPSAVDEKGKVVVVTVEDREWPAWKNAREKASLKIDPSFANSPGVSRIKVEDEEAIQETSGSSPNKNKEGHESVLPSDTENTTTKETSTPNKDKEAPPKQKSAMERELYNQYLSALDRQRSETEARAKMNLSEKAFHVVKKWGEKYQRLPLSLKVGIGIGLAGGAFLSSGILGAFFATGVAIRRGLVGAATAVTIEAFLQKRHERGGATRTERQESRDRLVALMSGAVASFGIPFANYISMHAGEGIAMVEGLSHTVNNVPNPAIPHEKIANIKGVINQLFQPDERLLEEARPPIIFHPAEHAVSAGDHVVPHESGITPPDHVDDVDADATKAGWHEIKPDASDHAVSPSESATTPDTSSHPLPSPEHGLSDELSADELQIRNMYGMSTEAAIANPEINERIQQALGRRLTEIYHVSDGHHWLPGGMDPRWETLRDLPGGARELLYRPESLHAPGFNFIGNDETTKELARYVRSLYASTQVELEPKETIGHYIRRMLAYDQLRAWHNHQPPHPF
ncbi:MAG: hypothetical protein ACYC8S_02225 [Minisyncoccota bacterium]